MGMRVWMGVAALCVPLTAAGQAALPPGTILPVSLDRSLNAAKARAGQTFQATVMQTIPGTSVHRGAKVMGRVVESATDIGGGSRLTLRFDTIRSHGQTIDVRASLRALASFVEVEAAQVPEEMGIRGTTPETATTQQIGGEQVYRGGGPVTDGLTVVGQPVPYGVLAMPRAQRGLPCRAEVAGNRQPQAFWLFSSNACGVYGYPRLRIEQASRSNEQGKIVLVQERGRLELRSGTGLLLRVQGS